MLHKNVNELWRRGLKTLIVYYSRVGNTRKTAEEIAHRVAWSAVKHQYVKTEDAWVPRV